MSMITARRWLTMKKAARHGSSRHTIASSRLVLAPDTDISYTKRQRCTDYTSTHDSVMLGMRCIVSMQVNSCAA